MARRPQDEEQADENNNDIMIMVTMMIMMMTMMMTTQGHAGKTSIGTDMNSSAATTLNKEENDSDVWVGSQFSSYRHTHCDGLTGIAPMAIRARASSATHRQSIHQYSNVLKRWINSFVRHS